MAKYLRVKDSLCCTEIGDLITVDLLETHREIMPARLRNIATTILIKLLYEAVSSADNFLRMVSKAPLSLVFFSHNLSGPFFRFSCSSPSQMDTTTRKHDIDVNVGHFCIMKLQQNDADPSPQGDSQYLKVRNMFPRLAR